MKKNVKNVSGVDQSFKELLMQLHLLKETATDAEYLRFYDGIIANVELLDRRVKAVLGVKNDD